MDNAEFLNLIEELYAIKGDFDLNKIARIIAEKPYANISNCMVLWNNQINSKLEPLIYQEDVKGNFPLKMYFTSGLPNLTETIGPLSGNDIKQDYSTICGENISVIQSVCLLPVENNFNQSKAIIIFLSFNKKIGFTKEQITLLRMVISELFNSRSTYLIEQFENIISTLSDFNQNKKESKKLSEKYEELSRALEPFKQNICHFSIWKIDDLENNNYKIIEEKNKNFKHIVLKGQSFLKKDDNHIISSYIQNFICSNIHDLHNEFVDFSQCISSNIFKITQNFESCLTQEYCKEVGIIDGNTTTLIIPIFPRKNLKFNYIYILCLYINNIHLTIFRGSVLISLISHKIYETFILHDEIVSNQTTEEILNATMVSSEQEENLFYKKIIQIFKEKNECKNCVIYFRNNLTDSYDFMSLDRYETKDICIKDFVIPIPLNLLQSRNFMIFLKDYLYNNIVKGPNYKDNIFYNGDTIVKSALIVPVFDQGIKKNELICFALLINKNIKRIESEKNSEFFLIHNENIIQPGLAYINKYHQFKEAANNKETLLKRIRHEIPNEVNLIRQNAEIIKSFFSKTNIQSYGFGNNKHFIDIINQLSLSNMRIELYAGFATTVGFETPKIMSKMEHLNLSIFLYSMIDIFQMDALEHGVRIRFIDTEKPVILYVSQLYKLSIVNLITNAIKYSYWGTCIIIRITEHYISVENIGIPIPEEDKFKIYKENYRGEIAKTYNQDGLGYGLFLAKKIIEAHKGHHLSHISEQDQKRNLYGIAALYNLFGSKLIDINQKMNIFNNQLDDEDKYSIAEFNKELISLASYINNDSKPYSQIDIETTKDWIFTKFYSENILYDDFVRIYLFREAYRTIFTIKF